MLTFNCISKTTQNFFILSYKHIHLIQDVIVWCLKANIRYCNIDNVFKINFFKNIFMNFQYELHNFSTDMEFFNTTSNTYNLNCCIIEWSTFYTWQFFYCCTNINCVKTALIAYVVNNNYIHLLAFFSRVKDDIIFSYKLPEVIAL